jgi:Xaa-Pro dipeptidase
MRAQNESINAIRPGLKCKEIDQIARAVVDKTQFGTGFKYFTHRLGHGIGLQGIVHK